MLPALPQPVGKLSPASPMMCDRSFCRPGNVGSRLNLPSTAAAASFCLPSLPANGSRQLTDGLLPALSYPPRGSLAWPCASPCPGTPTAGHQLSGSPPPPYHVAALPLPGRSAALDGLPRFCDPHAGAVARKPVERGRQSRDVAAVASPTKGPGLPDAGSGAAAFQEDRKQTVTLNLTLQPTAAPPSPGALLQHQGRFSTDATVRSRPVQRPAPAASCQPGAKLVVGAGF